METMLDRMEVSTARAGRKLPLAVITAAALLGPGSPAGAFGPLGHRVVAEIAEERLGPAAKKALGELMDAPSRLSDLATCADNLLYATSPIDCGGVLQVPPDPVKLTQPRHYINVSVRSPADPARLTASCIFGKGCVVSAIAFEAGALASPRSSRRGKQLALMFLVHLVADAHQPLHCGDDDDWGGNKKPVKILGAQKNLHSLWDDLVLKEDWRAQDRMDPRPMADVLGTELSGRDLSSWLGGNADKLATQACAEGHEIARTTIYPRYFADPVSTLDERYQDVMRPIVEERLQKAGVRLAAILEAALVGAPTTAVSMEGARQALKRAATQAPNLAPLR